MLALLVLSTLGASIVFKTQTEIRTSTNYQRLTQARYAAEAGVQKTINWLAYTYAVPATFTSYDLTKRPVQDAASHSAIILSALSSQSSNYPDSSVQSAFNTALNNQSVPGISNATFSTYATLISMDSTPASSWYPGSSGHAQVWQITSQGSVSGAQNATVQVVATYEKVPTPIFNYAVAATSSACKAIYFAGTDYTDSYNSNNGPYGGTNVQASGGNVGTNGNVTLASGANIKGTISVLNTTVGACPDGVTNSGTYSSINKLNASLNYPLPWGCSTTPCFPSPLPPTTAQDVSTSCGTITGCTSNGTTSIYDNNSLTTVHVYTLTPGSYGNVKIDNADVVHMSAGTYNLNSLNFAKDGQVVVDSGPVVVNLAGEGFSTGTVLNSGGLSGMNLCSGGVTGNPGAYGVASCGSGKSAFSGIPGQMQIVYAGTASIGTTGAPFASVIYAPNAPVSTSGAAVGFYGSIVASTFTEGSKAPVHYDNALATSQAPIVGPFQPTGFTWSNSKY
jgi:hypothetical protein